MKYANILITVLACSLAVGCKRDGEEANVKLLESTIRQNLPSYVEVKEFRREDVESSDKRHVTIKLTGVVAAKEPLYLIDEYDFEDPLDNLVEREPYWSATVPAILFQHRAPGDTFEAVTCSLLGNKVGKEWTWQVDIPLMKEEFLPLNLGRPISKCPKFHFLKDSPELAAYQQEQKEKKIQEFTEKRAKILSAMGRLQPGLSGNDTVPFGRQFGSYQVKVASVEGAGENTKITFELTEMRGSNPAISTFIGKLHAQGNFCELEHVSGPKPEGTLTFVPEERGNQLAGIFQMAGNPKFATIFLK